MADGSPSAAVYEKASASLLSEQPATSVPYQAVENWTVLYNHVQTRMNGMKPWRMSWWEHWGLLAEYILPRRYHWLITPNNMVRGLPISGAIVDPTGTQAMRTCAAGLMTGLSSPSRPWFKIKASTAGFVPDYPALLWFEEVETRVYEVMAKSNFYDSLYQMYEDNTTFGTAPMLIYEDAKDIIRCYNPCAGEYYLAADSTLRVDSFYRWFNMTVTQIVGMFGLKNCPPAVQQMWAQKGARLDTEFIVAHAIEPNFAIADGPEGKPVNILKGNFTYREVYWMYGMGTQAPLSVRGFYDAPFIAPRWATTSNDPYGRSVAMDVLPDIMQLQVETRRKAEAIEKQVRPPLLASIELKNEPSSILPGHITYVAGLTNTSGMRPIYQVQPDLQYMTVDLKEIQDRIRRGFFNDLFLMIANQPAVDRTTAYEIAQKNQEKLQVLGPVIERMQNEAHSPAIKRIVNILDRKNALPPLPDSLKNIPLQIEYISMLALAQQAQQSAGMERLLNIVGSVSQAEMQLGQATGPTAFDNIDRDEFVRRYATLMTVAPGIMKAPEQVLAERKAKAKAAQAAQAEAKMAQAGTDAVSGAKDLSQTDVGGGINALQLMLGNGATSGAQPGTVQ